PSSARKKGQHDPGLRNLWLHRRGRLHRRGGLALLVGPARSLLRVRAEDGAGSGGCAPVRPVRITLSDFLSHHATELELEGLEAIAIVGENGAGKSSLIEGLRWALFGGGRGRSPDHYVRAGASSCRVVVEFELAGRRYLVERQRELGKTGKSYLGLFGVSRGPRGENLWPIGGDSISETQAKIEQLLGMDEETWIRTSFLAQGSIDAFSRATPAARKELLSKVLELERYEQLTEAARTRVRQLEGDAAVLRQRAADLEGLAEQQATARTDCARLGRLAEQTQLEIEDLEAQVRAATEELEAARLAAAGAGDLERQRQELMGAEAELQALKETAGRIAAL